jgi:hypothetical protein
MNRPAPPYQADTLTRSRIPLTGHEIAKNDRNLALAHRSRRDFKGDVGKDLARTIDGITIEIEKCERCQKRRSLVSIDERMVGSEREVKSRRHLKYILMQELAAELSHRLRHGGFQETAVAKSLRSAVLSYLRGVNFQDIIDVEEFRIQSARSFNAL